MFRDRTGGDEQLSSHSELALVGEILDTIGLRKPDFGAIEPFRDDPLFATLLRLDVVPASPTLRQRLNSANVALKYLPTSATSTASDPSLGLRTV